MGLHRARHDWRDLAAEQQIKSFYTAKETYQQNEKAIYEMGGSIFKIHILQVVNIQNIQETHVTQNQNIK